MLCVIIAAIAILGLLYFTRWDKLGHIPGPPRRLIFGNALDVDPDRPRLMLRKWHKQYGDAIRVRFMFEDMVVVTGNVLYDTMVTQGNIFAGRHQHYRLNYIFGAPGMTDRQPDIVWKGLRKVVHGHLKQFGTGLSKLESHITEASEVLVETFRKHETIPLDPKETINEATLFVLSRLIIGPRIDKSDQLYSDLKVMANEVTAFTNGTSVDHILFDLCPSVFIHFPISISRNIEWARNLLLDCWCGMKSKSKGYEDSMVNVLQKVTQSSDLFHGITEDNIRITCIDLMLAGQATTVPTMYAIIHVLAHVPGIQENTYQEISSVLQGRNETVSLRHKVSMPYIQALIYETLRYFHPAPTGLLHTATEDTYLSSVGRIPKGTLILPNLSSLHHDESFWGNPDVFCPERFLDEDGQLLPATDPKRKHIMPFGAGPRVCVGEVFALSRLFLWTASLIQKFRILASDDDKHVANWVDPWVHPQDSLLHPLPYKVLFKPR